VTDDEVYAMVAYILYSNDLVDEDFVLSNENFAEFQMYNAKGFVVDDRPTAEYALWTGEPCMENCKDAVAITMRASVLDVTPMEEGAKVEETSATQVAQATTTEAEPEPAAGVEDEPQVAAVDPELIKKGEKVFKKCKACHAVGEGAKNKSGPQLNDLFGRPIGGVDGFRYSDALVALNEAGEVWGPENMAEWLEDPAAFAPGTKMNFKLRDAEERRLIAGWLAQNED
jgi:cytochrome c